MHEYLYVSRLLFYSIVFTNTHISHECLCTNAKILKKFFTSRFKIIASPRDVLYEIQDIRFRENE